MMQHCYSSQGVAATDQNLVYNYHLELETGFIDFGYSDNKWSQQYNTSAAEWEDAGYSNEQK